MNKRNLVCLCAVAALAIMGCNESKKWSDSPTCGNGIIERGEICDGSVNVSCSYFNPNVKWLTGTPGCSTNCELTQGSCTAEPNIISQTCGNNQLDAGESCDGALIADPNMNCEFFHGAGATGAVTCVNCQISSSSCVPAGTSANCGNGTLDAGETCDGSDFGGKTCIDFAGAGASGNLSCAANCVLDSTACVPATSEATCGNGKVEGSENCDVDAEGNAEFLPGGSCGSAYGGVSEKVTGEAKCTSTCTVDMSECRYCGDGIVSAENEEECDIALELSGVTCETGKGPGSEGTVKCADYTCKFDYSGCSDVEIPENCNDGNLDDDEQCDAKDGNVIYKDDATCETIKGEGATGELSCSAACRIIDTACQEAVSEKCGNDTLDDDEQCDTVSGEVKYKDDATCETIKGAGSTGNLSCDKCKIVDTECKAAEPECGDNALNGTEECETVNGQVTYIDNKTCESYKGTGATGELACNECAINSEACKAAEPPKTCPNGEINGEEECDGNDKIAANFSCGDGKKLITAGKVVCNENCTVNKEQSCKDACGDTVMDSGEDCDGDASVPATETCAKHDANKPEGKVKCSDTCKFDYSDCKAAAVTCPNGKIDGTEECDGDKVADSFSCGTGKKLKEAFVCKNDCTIDKAQSCITACGDNVKDDGEDCDGTDPITRTCADENASKPNGTVKCSTTCQFDYSDCKAAGPTCNNDNHIDAGEECDGTDIPATETCANHDPSKPDGKVKCTDCKLDYSSCTASGVTKTLFISEIVHGTNNNRAIELYNPTDEEIDLSKCVIDYYMNKSTTAASNQSKFTGKLAAGATYVHCSTALAENKTYGSKCNDSKLTAEFNGDDTIVLICDGKTLDSAGKIAAQISYGKNKTLTKKCGIYSGDTDPNDDFDVNKDWDGHGKDNFTYLGAHKLVCD